MIRSLCCSFFLLANACLATELVVPFGAGGGADLFARAAAQYYKKVSQENIVVINRAGAGGIIGTNYVLRTHKDGSGLIVANAGSFVFNKVFQKIQLYDHSEFEVIAPLTGSPAILSVSNTKINNLQQFVAEAKHKKNYSCGSSSQTGLILGRIILNKLKLNNVEIVVYKSAVEVTTALLGKHIDCSFDNMSSHMPLIRAGKINVLAVSSESSHSAAPKAKLFKDIVPNLTFNFWYGIGIPKSVNPADRETLLSRFLGMGQDPEFQKYMQLADQDIYVQQADATAWIEQQYRTFDRMREEIGLEKQ